MKYLFALLSVFVFFQFNVNAQQNFKPGYIVTLKGDTTKGFVDYKEWNQNPKSISFKIAKQAATQQFSVSNASAFGVNNFEEYRRYVGPISVNAVATRSLINSKDTSVVRDSVFLKLVTTGKYITLFEYTDHIKERFFVSEGNSAPVELKYYKYFDARNTQVLIEKTYGQQLQRLVNTYHAGDIAMIQQIQAAEYQLKDLEKVVYAINGSDGPSPYATSSRAATQFFVGLAANATHFSFKSSTISSNTSVLPQLSVGFNVFFNESVRKVLFRADLNVTGSKADISSKTMFANGGNYTERLSFNQLTTSLSSQFIVNIYNTEALKAF